MQWAQCKTLGPFPLRRDRRVVLAVAACVALVKRPVQQIRERAVDSRIARLPPRLTDAGAERVLVNRWGTAGR